MRSIRFLAVATGALVLGSACGGDGGGTGPNNDPVANFTVGACTPGVPCTFTDASADPEGNNTITTRKWNFGDGTAEVTDPALTQSHTFQTANTYQVTLTVTDNGGKSNSKTIPVIVAGANLPPVASFVLPTDCTAGTPCGFHSTSTDADGTIATSAWNFGDTGTDQGADVTHTYTAAGTYTVSLTVTDNLGLAGTPATQQLVVTAPAAQDCTTTGTKVACSLTMTQRVTVKITVISKDCQLSGNDLDITGPRQQRAFSNLCNRLPGDAYTVVDADGVTPTVFTAGTPLALRFSQGIAGAGDPPTGDPGIQISGSYPNWTLNIDDGGAAGTPGEPDFNDAVLSVQATLAP